MKFLRFLYYSNFFYALCAASQVVLTLGPENICDSWPIISIVSSFAYLAYCIPFFIKVLSKDRFEFADTSPKLYSITIPLGTFLCLVALFFLRSEVLKLNQLLIILTVAITSFYFSASRFGKFIGWLKPFLNSSAWFLATIVLTPNHLDFWVHSYRYLIFFIVAFYFDVMDIETDASNQLSTIAVRLGFETSKTLIIFLSMVGFVLAVIASFFSDQSLFWVCASISPLVIYKLSETLVEGQNKFINRFFADCSLIFPAGLMLLLSLLRR